MGRKVGTAVGDNVGSGAEHIDGKGVGEGEGKAVGWRVGFVDRDRKLGFGLGGQADRAGETVGNGMVTLFSWNEGYQCRQRSSDFL